MFNGWKASVNYLFQGDERVAPPPFGGEDAPSWFPLIGRTMAAVAVATTMAVNANAVRAQNTIWHQQQQDEWPTPPVSPWTRTGGGSAYSFANTATQSATVSSPVAVGDLVLVSATYGIGPGATGDVITDDLGNFYTRIDGSAGVLTPGQNLVIWASIVAHAGTPTVTLQYLPTPGTTVADRGGIAVDTFTGSGPTSITDGTGSSNEQSAPTTAADALVSGSWTTAKDGDLIYSATYDFDNTNPGDPGSGFTAGVATGTDGPTTEYGVQSSHGSIQATWTAGTNDGHITSAVAISLPRPSLTYAGNQLRRIDHTKIGSTDLHNFVFPVHILANSIPALKSVANGGQVQSTNGFDIDFTNIAGEPWNFQLLSYDPATGEVLAWVQAPAISHSVDTYYRIQWGNSSVTSDRSTTATWDGTFDYAATFDTVSSAPDGNDKTANGITASNGTGVSADSAHALVGQDAAFASGNSGINTQTTAKFANTGPITVSISVNVTTMPTGGSDAMCIERDDDSGPWGIALGVNDVSGAKEAKFAVVTTSAGPAQYTALGGTNLSAGTPYRLGGVYDPANNQILLYVNGVQDTTPVSLAGSSVTRESSTPYFGFGVLAGTSGSSRSLIGYLDEPRISHVVRSDSWMLAEYNSIHDTQNFSTGVAFDGDGWFDSLGRTASRVAITAALALNTSAARSQPFAYQQDEIFTSAPTAVVEDAELPALQVPWLPFRYAEQWSYQQDDPAGSLYAVQDELEQPVIYRPWQANRWAEQWTFQQDDPAGSFYAVQDELEQPVTSLPWARYRYTEQWQYQSDEPAGSFYVPQDEDPLPVLLRQWSPNEWQEQWSYQQDEPAATLYAVQDELELPVLNRPWAQNARVEQWTYQQDEVPPQTQAIADDDTPPVVYGVWGKNRWPEQWSFDVQEPAGSLYVPQDEFPLPVLCRTWQVNLHVEQWSFQQDDPTTLYAVQDEDPLPVIQRPWSRNGWTEQWVYDVQEPAGSLYAIPEDDAPPQLVPPPYRAKYAEQWTYEQNDLATPPSVVVTDDESPIVLVSWPRKNLDLRPWQHEQNEPAFGLYAPQDEDPLPVQWKARLPFRYAEQWQYQQDEITRFVAEDDTPTLVQWPRRNTYAEQATFDQQEPAGSLYAPQDELELPVIYRPWPQNTWHEQWTYDPEEPAGSLSGQYEDDSAYVPVVHLRPRVVPTPWSYAQNEDAVPYFADDDTGLVPVVIRNAPVYRLVQQWQYVDDLWSLFTTVAPIEAPLTVTLAPSIYTVRLAPSILTVQLAPSITTVQLAASVTTILLASSITTVTLLPSITSVIIFEDE